MSDIHHAPSEFYYLNIFTLIVCQFASDKLRIDEPLAEEV